MKNLRKKSVAAMKWAAIEKIAVQVSNVGFAIYLGRILSPKEFGLVAMVTVFTGVLNVFRDFGLGSALIQKKDVDDLDLDTMFWTNVIFGIFLTIVVVGMAYPIAFFYEDDNFVSITLAISINFFIFGFSYVQDAMLKKSLNFKKLFYAHLLSVVLSGIFAVYLASSGYGVWSLLWRTISMNLIVTLFLWIGSSYRPKFRFSKERFRGFMNYALPLLATKVLNYFIRNLDNLLIGRVLGSVSLGLYSRGYQFMLSPIQNVTGIVSKVLFSSMSAIHDDLEQVRRMYIKAIRIISIITFPMMVGMYFSTDSFVLVLLGEKWDGAIPIIKVLTFVGAIQSIGVLVGVIFNSQAQNMKMLKMNIWTSAVYVVGLIIGLYFGLMGVVYSVLISSLIVHVPQAKLALGVIDLKLSDYWNALKYVFFASLITFLILYLGLNILIPTSNYSKSLFGLFTIIPLSVIINLIFLYFLNRAHFVEFKKVVLKDILNI